MAIPIIPGGKSRIDAIFLDPEQHRPFWSYSEIDISERLWRLQKGKRIFLKLNGVNVYRTPIGKGVVCWAAVDDQIIYEGDFKFPTVEWPTDPQLREELPYQSSVWRDRSTAVSANLPSAVFQKMYAANGAIVSDLGQSKAGREFWQYQVFFALKRRQAVYLCKMQPASTAMRRKVLDFVPVTALADFNRAYSSNPATGTLTFLCIRKQPLVKS